MNITFKLILLILLVYSSYTDIYKKHVMMAPVYICLIAVFLEMLIPAGDESFSVIGIIPGVVLLICSYMTKGAIGEGDAYLTGVIGLMMGIENAVLIILVGSVLAAVFSVFEIKIRKKGKKDVIPFVPFILTGYLGVLIIA